MAGSEVQIVGLPPPHDHLNGAFGIIIGPTNHGKYRVESVNGEWMAEFETRNLFSRSNTAGATGADQRGGQRRVSFYGSDLAAALASASRGQPLL